MCGIFCLVTDPINDQAIRTWELAFPALQRRGPDAQGYVKVLAGNYTLIIGSSLLRLRGEQAPCCPLSCRADVLAYNGEVFGGLGVEPGDNDGQRLLEALCTPSADVARVLSQIQGPFALLFWQADSQRLWIARDSVGRRSLLQCHLKGSLLKGFCLSSTAVLSGIAAAEKYEGTFSTESVQQRWEDLAPGIYSMDFCNQNTEQALEILRCHAWDNDDVKQRLAYLREPQLFQQEVQPSEASQACDEILDSLKRAVKMHCNAADWRAHQAEGMNLKPARMLILFSGGVDSTLIAALAHLALPANEPIDLATICFDGGRSQDRAAALDAAQELSDYAPERQWRLVQMDASLADIDAHRSHLLGLLHPADTVMDLNIGAALWLAARAEGPTHLYGPRSTDWQDGSCYRSQSRIVLVGHGADEQCAGYGRHRTKYKLAGREGLEGELRLDMQRLWLRNLGRDDRLIADHGRESRHPFLDEDFTLRLLNLPLSVVTNLDLPAGSGDKLILREALCKLGLPRAAARVKRAIQFGTRLAKASNIREFGSNRGAAARHAGTTKLHVPVDV